MDDNLDKFSLYKTIEILERTPRIVSALLENISESWVFKNEGGDSWSPFDILGHYIHGDQTDWLERAKIILGSSDNKTFDSFDRFAQFENSKDKSLIDLLDQFSNLRQQKIRELKDLKITDRELALIGYHPELGEVNLKQLLATWVVHDLSHISHILRIMANQYKDEVGPWIKYLRILNY